MKIKLPIAVLMMFGFITCTKDSYNTSPTLKFESVNGTVFPRLSVVTFNLQCTDKEGDVIDTIWIKRISKVPFCEADASYYDSIPIPNFDPPKDVKADFQLSYNYGGSAPSLQGCSEHDDTVYFKFWMHDKAQHVSDTVQSPQIVLLKE